jgi:glycosyltransferase involved in cell wall biosynthesis
MDPKPTIEVIVPVHSMGRHLAECLSTILPQLGAADRVTVVDDASDDDTAEIGRAMGANVISLATSGGPYVARNVATRCSTADFFVFADARCRPRHGWLEAHRELLSEPGAALSCTNLQIVRGRSFASKIAYLQNSFDINDRIGIKGRWDWYPTANLGVRRSAFNAVGGFLEVRSGADEDLCRRIQIAGLGHMAACLETLMDWVPRDSLTALAKQWYRYGKGSVEMDGGVPSVLPPDEGRREPKSGNGTVAGAIRTARRRPSDVPALIGAAGMQALFFAGRQSALFHQRHPAKFATPQ